MYARGDTWATFQPHDDEKLEKRWQQLGGEQWARSVRDRVQDEEHKEQQSNTSSPSPRGPPSGVDAIQSALDGFADVANRTKQKAKSSKKGQSSSQASGSWLNGLRHYIPFAGTQDHQDDGSQTVRQDSSDKDSKKDSDKSKSDKVQVNYILDPDEPESQRKAKVEVMEDNLFDVDLESMTLFPCFWKGVALKVVRATWFYSSITDGSYAPISWDDPLSRDLDHAYSQAQPWLHSSSSSTDKESDDSDDSDVEEETDKSKLYPIPSMKDKGRVSFQDAEVGRIFSEDLRGRFLSVVGGSIVVRGFDRAEKIAEKKSFSPLFNISLPWAGGDEKDGASSSKGSSEYTKAQRKGTSAGAHSASQREGAAKTSSKPPSGGGADGPHRPDPSTDGDRDERKSFAAKLVPSSDAALRPLVTLKKLFGYDENEAADEEKRKVKQQMTEDELDRQRRSENDVDLLPDDRKDDPPELVFAIHGIGQQLTEDFEALDFVYDVEHLRNLASENARDPAIRRLSRGRRAQFIPICWRRFMEFDDKPESNDNFYTLDDVTNSAAIPLVRNVITKVVLDVPFYLSRHRKKMIYSVMSELNRTYRLFCRRNPDFERQGGRVSIIGHSLGSALAADILSAQPSKVPSLSEAEKSDRDALRRNDSLYFNVKNLFFIGSPVGFFFFLDGGQLIARSGTNRHPENKGSDALDPETGRYGCLAAENVYNCFNPNDPVAFQLAPIVDSAYAKLIKPISIESATEALLRSLALPRISITRIFEKYKDHPFQGVGKILRRAKILENNQEEALPADLSHEERRQVTEREMGQRIVDDSNYIRTVRKWHHLQKDSSDSSEAPSPKSRELQTEVGVRKKSLQPEAALHAAALSEGSDDEHFDLDSLERGERRFRALNPHGCIDYHLSASISLSGYLDMFGAHLAYWTHRDFAVFVLTQLFMDFTKKDEITLVPELHGTQRDDSDGDKGEEESDDDEGEEDAGDEDEDAE
ncbi:hypothetical protein NDA16_004395 [Ustilago loliicola]|nr:hypothetical protein NDA16_004395 [Ustilago loliicola]